MSLILKRSRIWICVYIETEYFVKTYIKCFTKVNLFKKSVKSYQKCAVSFDISIKTKVDGGTQSNK